jgi:hypothetical protein
MADPPKRRNANTSEIELESHQLTLEDWANVQEAARGKQDVQHGRNSAGALPVAGVQGAKERTRIPDAAIGGESARKRPAATELLAKTEALLTRSDLRELGLERRAVDAVFRALPVVALPGYSRPLVRAEDYRALVERNTFRDDRVRPGKRAA